MGFIKAHKNIVITVAIFLCTLLVALFFYQVAVLPKAQGYTTRFTTGTQKPVATPPLYNGTIIRQPFTNRSEDALYAFELPILTYGETVDTIRISGSVYNSETQEKLASFSETITDLTDSKVATIHFDKPLPPTQDELTLNVRLVLDKDIHIALPCAARVLPRAIIDGEPQPSSLFVTFMGDSWFLVPYYWIIAGALAVLLSAFWYFAFVLKWQWKNLFLVSSLLLGSLYMLVVTPYSMNDDISHIPTSFYYASQWFGNASPGSSYYQNRAEDNADGYTYSSPGREQLYHTQKNFFELEEEPGTAERTKVITAGRPYQYFPQAIGIGLARLFHLGQVPTLYLGRLMVLLCYTGIIYITLHFTPFKPLFTLLGLAPFVLYTAGSFSYDLSILSLSFFFTGYVLYLAYDKEKMSVYDIIVLCFAGLLLAPLKYIYVPLLFLPFLIPKSKWPRPLLKTIYCALLSLSGCLIFIWLVISIYGNGQSLLFTNMVVETPWLDPEGGYTYASLLAQPLELIRLLFFTAFDRLGEFVLALGSFQYNNLPLWQCCLAWILILFCGIPVQGQPGLVISKKQKGLMAFSGVLVYLLGLAAALPWTYIGSYYIRGAQGRYFIPIFPLVALLFHGFLQRKKNTDHCLLYGMILINAYAIFSLFLSVANGRLPLRALGSTPLL